MLKMFRQKNVTKVILWGILILILPAFVLWGSGSLGGSGRKGPKFVGTIDQKKVTFKEFADSLTSVRVQVILNYFNQPKVMETFLGTKAFVGKLAWDRLLMVKQAQKSAIGVPDTAVVAYIQSHPIFLRNGQFDPQMYAYILRRNIGLEPRAFEEMVRQNLEIKKLNDIITADVTISDEEVLENYRKENEKFKISYILFTSDSFVGETKISDDDARSYYDAHKDEFVLPGAEGDEAATAGRVAQFDDVKDSIKAYLGELRAREKAIAYANEQHTQLQKLMKAEGLRFEAAAAKLNLAAQESPFFIRSDYLEGIGDPAGIIDAAVKLSADEITSPVEAGKGAVVFRLVATESYDDGKFAEEKEAYAVKALEAKKMRMLEDWLRGLENANTINIDFKDYEKYYR